jgi:ABC-type glycerol-3-phosphate transport system substrate-binding protein
VRRRAERGALLCKLNYEDGYLNSLIHLADGRIAAMVYQNGAEGENGKNAVTVIDPAAKSWGDSMPAPFNAYNFYPGGGDYDYYYNNDTNFFGAKLSSGESEKLFNWINCDIDSNNISTVVPLSDGRVLCVLNSWNNTEGTSTSELAVLTKTEASLVQQKTILTFACMYVDYNLRSRIIDFNKNNGQYRIEVSDYSEYNTEDDYNAGITKLSTEIIAGKVPDILSTSQLPVRQYAAKGLLEDLWPFIESDPELGRDKVVEPVFKALEQDGKLYQVTPSFSVFTAAGAPALVGDTPGWTLDELYEALGELPDGAQVFNQYSVQNDILQQCCAMAMDGFVNWDTGECSFDSPEFAQILEFAASFPAEFDWENYDREGDYESEYSRIQNGKQLLSIVYGSDFQTFQMYKALFGGSVTFVGFPTASRNGSAFMINTGLAMSSQCADKDGAWQFIRSVLTTDYQTNNIWEFPSNKEAFDAKLKEAMTPEYYTDPVTGEQVEQSKGSWGWDRDLMVEMYALTQEEADQILDLIDSTNRVYAYDQEIFDIISDDTAAFFAGQKSADETAKLIQNRVSLYVNEQR